MSSNRPGGTKCHMRNLLYLLLTHWALAALPLSSHAACSELKAGYQRVNYLLQDIFLWSKSSVRQHLLETTPSIRASPKVYANAPGPFISPALSPGSGPAPLPDLLPSDPPVTIPYAPGPGIATIPIGNCSINFTAIEKTFYQTVVDCGDPLTKLVGVAICCPQFDSLLRIVQGQYFKATGVLGLNDTQAESCISEIADVLQTRGTNSTAMCKVQAANLTVGSCPIRSMAEFEMLVDSGVLLQACKTIDPLKECETRTCQNEIGNATLRLAQGVSGAEDYCDSVVLSWLASHSTPEEANNFLRFLSSCSVDRECPLAFGDTSAVSRSCNSSASFNTANCCGALSQYMQNILQTQMLITNQQAYKCANTFGYVLQSQGVTVDLYANCSTHLFDFSPQGCLLPSQPTDINVTTGKFQCDLNNGILAQWPELSAPAPQPSMGASLSPGFGRMALFIVMNAAALSVYPP